MYFWSGFCSHFMTHQVNQVCQQVNTNFQPKKGQSNGVIPRGICYNVTYFHLPNSPKGKDTCLFWALPTFVFVSVAAIFCMLAVFRIVHQVFGYYLLGSAIVDIYIRWSINHHHHGHDKEHRVSVCFPPILTCFCHQILPRAHLLTSHTIFNGRRIRPCAF